MLPKKNRVNKGLFETIMKKGRIVSSPFFTFRYLPPTKDEKNLYFACVAPKTVAKRANQRNALRRKGYVVARTLITKPFSGILFFKKEAKEAENSELINDFKGLLEKTHLL